MKPSTLTIAAIQFVGATAVTTKCSNGNNCARAITGTYQSLQTSRRNDCSAFQQCTVTPTAKVTVTVTAFSRPPDETTTATITTTTTVTSPAIQQDSRRDARRNADSRADPISLADAVVAPELAAAPSFAESAKPRLAARQVNPLPVTNCPTGMPSYASACVSSSAYASACSCAGVTKRYTTVSAVDATLTVTQTGTPAIVTVQETSTVTQTVSPVFQMRVRSSAPNLLVKLTSPYESGQRMLYLDAAGEFATFRIIDGLLSLSGGTPLWVDQGTNSSPLFTQAYPGDVTFNASMASVSDEDGGFLLTLDLPGGKRMYRRKNRRPDVITTSVDPDGDEIELAAVLL